MMVLPDSAASDAGLKADDLILRVNGESVHDNRDLMQFIEQSYFMVLIEGTRAGETFSLILKKRVRSELEAGLSFQSRLKSHSVYSSLHRSAELGLIPVPATDSAVFLELSKPDPLGRFRRLKEKLFKLGRRQKNGV
jgi:C-terminal processing protease CtpA/Prc